MDVRVPQRYAGVPARYLGRTVSSLGAQAHQTFGDKGMKAFTRLSDAAEAWLADDESWALVLHGPSGTGKTALACALIGSAGVNRLGGYVTAAEYVDRVRDREDLWPMIDQVGLLVVDDLGSEYATYFSNSSLDGLIARLYDDSGRKLIITTNMSPDQIAESYSERMRDRLSERSLWLSFRDIPSFRRANV